MIVLKINCQLISSVFRKSLASLLTNVRRSILVEDAAKSCTVEAACQANSRRHVGTSFLMLKWFFIINDRTRLQEDALVELA